MPWVLLKYRFPINFFNQNPKKVYMLGLVLLTRSLSWLNPHLLFLLAIGLLKGPGQFWICPYACLRCLWANSKGRRQEHPDSCFSHGSDRFPFWLSVCLLHNGDLPGLRRPGHAPSIECQQVLPDLFFLFTLRAGLCLCKYQAILQQGKESK